jgi:uncharacterized protein
MNLADRISAELSPSCFSVLLKNVWRSGPKKADGLEVYDIRTVDYRTVENDLRQRLLAYCGSGGGGIAECGVGVCYASKANSLTIRSDGSIGKCTVALKSSANSVGRINIDGSLSIDSEKFSPWLHGLASMKPGDLECPARHLPGTTGLV